VGLNVVQGARIAGATSIMAVDVSETKLALARRLGATDTVDARHDDPVAAVRDRTGQRGADVAFEVIGTGTTIDQAIAMTRRGGQAVLVGLPSLDVTITLPAMIGVILAERTIKGCWYGSSSVRRDVPRLVELYRTGELQVEPLVSDRIGLADVNSALERLAAGRVARSVIAF
jgi:Zn-dependent alcohol dehydrogenase